MTDPGPAVNAPDFVSPVVGYRAWRVTDDGVLQPFSASGVAVPWEPGINRAECQHQRVNRLAADRHAAPDRDCKCGLYALHDPYDRRLDFTDQIVGSIAAWGEMEIHATGFRAQYACVTVLAQDRRMPPRNRGLLRTVAATYRVEVVAHEHLVAEALRHATTLPDDVLPDSGRFSRLTRPTLPGPSGPGLWPERHVWLCIERDEVVVGITVPLARALGGVFTEAPQVESGTVARGQPIARLGEGDEAVFVSSPVSGTVIAVNPVVLEQPGRLGHDPEGAGWIARISPTNWHEESEQLDFSRGGRLAYRSELAEPDHGFDPYGSIRCRQRAGVYSAVRSWDSLLGELRSWRRRPRYADARAVESDIVAFLSARLGEPGHRHAAMGIGLSIALVLSQPELEIALTLGPETVTVTTAVMCADITLSMTATVCEQLLGGSIELRPAVATGEIGLEDPAGRVGLLLSLLAELRPAFRARRR